MNEEPLPDWKRVWREGFAPLLPAEHLMALLGALREGSPLVITKYTVMPVSIRYNFLLPAEAACPVGFCAALSLGGFKGSPEPATVEEVSDAFGELCHKADMALGEMGGCRFFLNAVDCWTREELAQNLGPELERELASREGGRS